MLVPRRCISRRFDSENIYRIHSRNNNFSPELSTNLLFLNLCICFLALQTAEKSSPERPGCGAEPHLLSRRQPLRAAALLRTLASRSRKYSLSAEFPVIGTASPRRRAQPSRGPWNTAAPRARICRESPLTAVKLRVRLCTTCFALGYAMGSESNKKTQK